MNSHKKKPSLVLMYIILLFFACLFILPLWYNLVYATRDTAGILEKPHMFSFGANTAANMDKLLRQLPDFWLNVFNTILVSVLAAGTQIFFCTMAGFAFARYNFKGRKILFKLLLIIAAIPPVINIIPQFRMMVFFKWTNTLLPLFIPGMANAFGIFLMTRFIEERVPGELIEAARMEGLGELQIFFNVCFPLVKPCVTVLGVIVFINTWNEFVAARVMLNDKAVYTLSVALSALSIRADGNYGALLLAGLLNVLPVILLFLVSSRKLMEELPPRNITSTELENE